MQKPADPHGHPPDHPLEEDIVHALEPDERTPLPALIRRWTLRFVPFVLLTVAAFALWREFRHLSFGEVASAMTDWGYAKVALALVLSAVSFLLMGVVEQLGLRWTRAKVPVARRLPSPSLLRQRRSGRSNHVPNLSRLMPTAALVPGMPFL